VYATSQSGTGAEIAKGGRISHHDFLRHPQHIYLPSQTRLTHHNFYPLRRKKTPMKLAVFQSCLSALAALSSLIAQALDRRRYARRKLAVALTRDS
jgi:hypothetical protein